MFWIDDLFSPEQCDRLLAYAIRHEEQFDAATTKTGAADWRAARVLREFGFQRSMKKRVRELLPSACEALAIAPFTPSLIECQLTASNDGDFYRRHNDNGHPACCDRRITFVYYFWRSPKGFTGGQLILDGQPVEPRQNCCLLFPSNTYHEIAPVDCPSREFGDSRFTLNGWISGSA